MAGNAFGNYPTTRAAERDLEADGFTYANGYWRKPSMTGGSLSEGPRPCVAIVTIVRRNVLPEYGGQPYYQQMFHS